MFLRETSLAVSGKEHEKATAGQEQKTTTPETAESARIINTNERGEERNQESCA